MMDEKVISKVEEKIKEILDDDITPSNLDNLYKLSKIKHMAKEDKNMNYGNYGNYNGRGPSRGSYGDGNYGTNYGNYGAYGNYGNYGNYGDGSYGRRGYDAKYRGYDHIDRMGENYGRYMEGRERYGANEDTKKSLEYMLRSAEDFFKMLKEDAQSQEEVMMIKETAQRIAQM